MDRQTQAVLKFKSNKAENSFDILVINRSITFTLSHQSPKFMLAQFNSFSTWFLKDCYICGCCPHKLQTDPVSRQSLTEVLTFHGVAAEAAGGANAVQPSTKTAGEALASCGQQEIHEVLPLHLESLVSVAVLTWSSSLVLPAWRSLALT